MLAQQAVGFGGARLRAGGREHQARGGGAVGVGEVCAGGARLEGRRPAGAEAAHGQVGETLVCGKRLHEADALGRGVLQAGDAGAPRDVAGQGRGDVGAVGCGRDVGDRAGEALRGGRIVRVGVEREQEVKLGGDRRRVARACGLRGRGGHDAARNAGLGEHIESCGGHAVGKQQDVGALHLRERGDEGRIEGALGVEERRPERGREGEHGVPQRFQGGPDALRGRPCARLVRADENHLVIPLRHAASSPMGCGAGRPCPPDGTACTR